MSILETLPKRMETSLATVLGEENDAVVGEATVVGNIWAPLIPVLVDIALDLLADCGVSRTQELSFLQKFALRRRVRRDPEIEPKQMRTSVAALEHMITSASPEDFSAAVAEFDANSPVEWEMW